MPKFNIKAQAIPTVASAYADIIGTTDNQIVEIRNELIVEDNKQKFQIHEDTIEQLAERISSDGQLSPCIVAPLPDGKYELIDGRHRRRAVIKAGLSTTKCIIKNNLSDKEKKTIRLTANLIRNNDYLPSELAYAYKELAELEDMKTISEETNLSKKKIYRYIRLTNLIEPLLSRVDSGAIPVIAAVELSFLTREQQNKLFEFLLNHPNLKISTANARFIKENPDGLYEAFYEEEVDNLSTNHDVPHVEHPEADEPSEVKMDNLSNENKPEQNTETAQLPELWYQDKNNNIHSCDKIEPKHLKTICEYVINTTHIDYYILRFAYDSKEVLQRWKENEIKTQHTFTNGRISVDWASSTKRMFQIRIGGDLYIMPHRVLEQLVRRYIRKNYTVEQIKALLEKQ